MHFDRVTLNLKIFTNTSDKMNYLRLFVLIREFNTFLLVFAHVLPQIKINLLQ